VKNGGFVQLVDVEKFIFSGSRLSYTLRKLNKATAMITGAPYDEATVTSDPYLPGQLKMLFMWIEASFGQISFMVS
jgi:hypothetical protein